MIVKISSSGKSFAGLATYLAHDPNAKTDERVAWTHTHNLANDHLPSAVDEMYWTAMNADLLKQEAGVRAGGRTTESPVKHVSLNWAPADDPSREHMIETSAGFLRHMGWNEHQAILIAHEDKAYRHVHIMLNAVHPETGKCLSDSFEQRRAQAWALDYEREQGRIHCEQRLMNVGQREKSPPRNIWMEFQKNQKEFERAEELLRENSDIPEYRPLNRKNEEWKILKEIQKEERIQFFADGKAQFSEIRTSIYREVREEFRERWSDYYLARKNGTDTDRQILTDVKTQLIADQKAALEPRRDAACAKLKRARELEYRELLGNQRAVRAEFGGRLETGIDNSDFFRDLTQKGASQQEMAHAFREASSEVTRNSQAEQPQSPLHAEVEDTQDPSGRSRREGDVADISKRHAASAAGAFLGSLFADLTNLGSAPPKPISADERADAFREAAENSLKQHQQHERNEDDARWRERQRAFGE
jgi:Relaxase/Mobilisation nuclease domain